MNKYYYIDHEGKQKGTYSADELKNEGVSKNTMVWTQGMDNWKPVSEVEELSSFFETAKSHKPEQTGMPPSPPQFQQYSARNDHARAMPKNWLIESILVTVLPFLICSNMLSLLGIVAIVYATKVESLFLRGDYTGSLEAARQAKTWVRITFWVAIGWILVLILLVVGFLIFGISMAGVGGLLGSLAYLI